MPVSPAISGFQADRKYRLERVFTLETPLNAPAAMAASPQLGHAARPTDSFSI